MSQIDTSSLEGAVDSEAIARVLVAEARKAKKGVPTVLDLTTAITKVTNVDTIQGSSSLTIALTDPELVIANSGFLDANKDGKLDPLQLNYPEGSDYWWMLTQVTVSNRETIELVFMERVAVWLQQFRGPLKVARVSSTRAEFIKMLVDKMKQNVDFHCSELKTVQPIQILPPLDPGKNKKGKVVKTKTASRKAKAAGMTDQVLPFIDGAKLTKEQVANANLAMTTATALTKNNRALLALVEACIVEGPRFSNPATGDQTSVGILQITGNAPWRRDIAKCVTYFMNGSGPPYEGRQGGGGAIGIATRNPTMTPGEIAQALQISGYPKRYEAVRQDAEAMLTAFGAGSLAVGGVVAKQKAQYNFQVGNSSNPRETYWDASQRLAGEVRWDFFVDGNDVYYDPETELIKQQPILYLERDHPGVIDWSYTWDSRHICTEFLLHLICDPDEFHAGEVFQLGPSFGPAGQSSSALLPGRWLVSAITRASDSWVSDITLKQPVLPGPEPATQSVNLPDAGVGDKSKAGLVYAEAAKLDSRNIPYVFAGGHGGGWSAVEANAVQTGLDCSSSVSVALHAAGLMQGMSGPQDSGWFQSSWGESGQGKNLTVWANASHVFIEFHNRKAMRFDTVPWGSGADGPHLRYTKRTDVTGFVAKRFPGDV